MHSDIVLKSLCSGTVIIHCTEWYSTEINAQWYSTDFVCVEVLRSSQPTGVMSSAVSLPNHTFAGQASIPTHILIYTPWVKHLGVQITFWGYTYFGVIKCIVKRWEDFII